MLNIIFSAPYVQSLEKISGFWWLRRTSFFNLFHFV